MMNQWTFFREYLGEILILEDLFRIILKYAHQKRPECYLNLKKEYLPCSPVQHDILKTPYLYAYPSSSSRDKTQHPKYKSIYYN
jgi:hypothetical protein